MKKLSEVIKEHVLKTLEECSDNRTKTAKQLGIGLRTLQRYLLKLKSGKEVKYGNTHGFKKAV